MAACLSSLASPLGAQSPTVAVARVAVASPATMHAGRAVQRLPAAECGSILKNGALLGLGLALAVGSIELAYTIVREPFARNGHDWPVAAPVWIAWAGGAGFVAGVVGTTLCRRRR